MIQLYNTDCIEYMKSLPNEYVDMVLTDPPYLSNYHSNMRKDKDHRFRKPIENDTESDVTRELIKQYIEQCHRILKQDTALYMFCNSVKVDFFKQEVERYFNIKNIIVWVKNSQSAGDLYAAFGRKYEFIIYANKGRCLLNGKRVSDVWEFPRVSNLNLCHQNQKPVDLLRQCIRYSCHNPNGIVFDGFAGSASTGIACMDEQRHFIGCELDKEYFEIGKRRLEEYK